MNSLRYGSRARLGYVCPTEILRKHSGKEKIEMGIIIFGYVGSNAKFSCRGLMSL
jgi:hypothetical protein